MGRNVVTKSGFKVYTRHCNRCGKRIQTKAVSRKVVCDDCNLTRKYRRFLSSEVKEDDVQT